MAVVVSFTFNINAHAVRQRDAICGRNGYTATLPDPNNPGETIPNPETKEQFAKRMTREWWQSETRAWELRLAEEASSAAIVPLDVVD
jgi:hypothetical protein